MLTERQLVNYVIDFLLGLSAWLYVLDSQDVSTCKKEKHHDVNDSWAILLFFCWFGFDRTTFLVTLVIWFEILLRIYLKLVNVFYFSIKIFTTIIFSTPYLHILEQLTATLHTGGNFGRQKRNLRLHAKEKGYS